MSKIDQLKRLAALAGMYVTSYSPGDGVTRYRFSFNDLDYFATRGEYTALGMKEAMTYARGAADVAAHKMGK